MSKKVMVILQSGNAEKMKRFGFLNDVAGAEVEFIDECVIESNTGLMRNRQMEKMGPDSFEYTPEYIAALSSANIIVTAMAPVPSAAFEGGNVEAVCILRSGVENVDRAKAAKANVRVINAPGRLAVPVSEYTVGLIIAEMKNIARGYSLLSKGVWNNKFPNRPYNINIDGATIGIIGCGAVGARVAKVMHAMEASVLVYDPYANAAALKEKGYEVVELDELCKRADVLCMHYRLTEETKGLLSAKHFELMKPTAFVVNTARAELIDEDALLDALKNKKIGGAALDVFKEEPLPATSPFVGLDNVTITPHLAGDCSNIFDITFKIVAKCIEDYFQSGNWTNIVPPPAV